MLKNDLTLGIAGTAFMLRRLIKLQAAAQMVAFPLQHQLAKITALDNALTEALLSLHPDMTSDVYLETAKTGLDQAIDDESTDL